MTAEVKLRTLARQSTALQSYFGEDSGLFRWFDRQLPPQYIGRGTCVRILRVSTLRYYTKETRVARSVNEQSGVRFQIDVLDLDPERARAAASAIVDWLGEIDLSTDDQFSSPPVTSQIHANFVLNQRAGIEPATDPPVYVEILDIRVFSKEAVTP